MMGRRGGGILWVEVFVLILWSSGNGGVVGEDHMKYKDPKEPVAVRVKDLLNRMTLEEKIGQMVQIDRTIATRAVMKECYIAFGLVDLVMHKYGQESMQLQKYLLIR